MSIEREVQSTFERYAAAWQANSGPDVAAFFIEDGTLMNPFGELAEGRAAIAAIYTEYFQGMLAGSSTRIETGTVRPVEDRHAFADSQQTVTGPGGEVILQLHLCTLLRREGDQWRIVDARAYSYASPPG